MEFHHRPQSGLKMNTYALPILRIFIEYFWVVKKKTMDHGNSVRDSADKTLFTMIYSGSDFGSGSAVPRHLL